jgi:hypothetical protein
MIKSKIIIMAPLISRERRWSRWLKVMAWHLL